MPTEDPFEADQAPLFETHLRAITESLGGNGIVSPGDLEITDGASGMDISIAAGSVEYNGTSYSLGSSTTKTLSTGDGSDDRWDTIAFDTATSSLVVREGTPAAKPVAPDIQGDELLLGVVEVAAGATTIGSGDIYNWRGPSPTSSNKVADLVDQPNGHLPITELADTDFADLTIPVPDGSTLEVYLWGCRTASGTTPAGLTVQLVDAGGTTQASANTARSASTSSPVASLANDSGSISYYRLRLDNSTGGAVDAGAVFGYQVI